MSTGAASSHPDAPRWGCAKAGEFCADVLREVMRAPATVWPSDPRCGGAVMVK